jgi:DNA-binding response OmpR family regulator
VQGLTINLDKHLVRSAEGEIDLTATEFKMLTLFAQAPGRVFTRSMLMDVIWGQEYYGVDRTVDTHVSRLRRKLGHFGEHIETVHGVGYKFAGQKLIDPLIGPACGPFLVAGLRRIAVMSAIVKKQHSSFRWF